MKELIETINDLKRRLRIVEQRAVVRGSEGIDCIQSPAGSILALNDRKIVYAMVTESEQFTDESGQTNYRHSWQEVSTSRVDGSLRDGSSVVNGQRRGNKNLLEYNRQQIANNTVLPIRECENGTGVWYGNAKPNFRLGRIARQASFVRSSGGGDNRIIFDTELVDTGDYWNVAIPTSILVPSLPLITTLQVYISTVSVDMFVIIEYTLTNGLAKCQYPIRNGESGILSFGYIITQGTGGGDFSVNIYPSTGSITVTYVEMQITSP